ncbi:alpha/beta hydrolase [Enterococcus florum]|uniref:Alpha/beta hydrolase n=1 Tax=Enterococcus florum TaxID=2480627 RepID=A0A4P5P839_9ENTE|nr:alpha/beta hydrolase [Enterococcus florum]GCF94137.1 alpha/beta hydrolase [Enterococcus florum]
MIIQANEVSLFYQKVGSGKPLLLLHGNGEDHQIFDELSAKLAKHYTVYALDSRNHGQSQKTADYSYETMTEDLFHFIEALNLSSVDLLGFSDGAIIGLMLAMKSPERIRRMALLGVNLSPEDFIDEEYQAIKEMYQKTRDPLIKLMLEQPQLALEDVRTVNLPILLIHGEHDLFKPTVYPRLKEALPQAEVKVMLGHDHDSYITHQDLLFPDLLDFFEA